MMYKVYTAQEMREFANYNDAAYARNPGLYSSAVSAALRQAADALEREGREKKHEYCVKYLRKKTGACIGRHAVCYDRLEVAKASAVPMIGETAIIIRREVGEWEEVE